MGLAFVPLYIKYLGIEAYGLIGIFALLQAWLSLLDMGMTPALGREMARFTGEPHDAQPIHNLLRSVEIIGCGVATLAALGIWVVSGWLASDWLRAEQLPTDSVAQAFVMMGVVTALRFVENIYRSSIVGLQKQVLLNVVTSLIATVRGLGAIGILVWISPSLEAFFVWQAAVSVSSVGLFAMIVYRILPAAPSNSRFSLGALQGIWRFAGGMIGITFLALLLTQIDKILLSNLLSLKEFGYYTLAAAVANALYLFVNPITQAFYPRFCELIARNDEIGLVEIYHKGAQLVTVLMGSAAMILIFFGQTVLQLWTQDVVLAHKVAPLVAVLALGTLFNGLMWVPYQMQLAHGWTSLAIKGNIVSVVIIVPAIFWATPKFGAIGAAWVWVALNAGYVLIGIHFMYRRMLGAEKWRWYFQDTLLPLAVAAFVAAVFHLTIPANTQTPALLAWLSATSAAIFIANAAAAPAMRSQFKHYLPRTLFEKFEKFVWLIRN